MNRTEGTEPLVNKKIKDFSVALNDRKNPAQIIRFDRSFLFKEAETHEDHSCLGLSLHSGNTNRTDDSGSYCLYVAALQKVSSN